MSDTPITLTLRLERDDHAQEWFPAVHTVTVAAVQGCTLAREGDDVYAPLAVEAVAIPQIVLVEAADAVRLRFGEQTTSNVPLAANGLFLLIGSVVGPGGVVCAAAAQTRLTAWVGGS